MCYQTKMLLLLLIARVIPVMSVKTQMKKNSKRIKMFMIIFNGDVFFSIQTVNEKIVIRLIDHFSIFDYNVAI